VIVGSRIWEHCCKRKVRIGFKSKLVSGNWESSLETSSVVIQVKDEKLGGVTGAGKQAEAKVLLVGRYGACESCQRRI